MAEDFVVDFKGQLDGEYSIDESTLMVDYTTRIITVGNISSGRLTPVIVSLLKLDSFSNDPITMVIRSIGGSLQESLLLREVILSLKSKVNTLAVDTCFSGALLLFSTGAIRSCFDFTLFLAHNITVEDMEVKDDVQMKQFLKHLGLENKYLLQILARASNRARSWWDDKIRKSDKNDFYFSSTDAKKFGLVNGEIFGQDNLFDYKAVNGIQ